MCMPLCNLSPKHSTCPPGPQPTHLAYILQQYRAAKAHSILQGAQHVLVVQLDHLQRMVALHVAHPLVGLALYRLKKG
jgi:hypothetical protein